MILETDASTNTVVLTLTKAEESLFTQTSREAYTYRRHLRRAGTSIAQWNSRTNPLSHVPVLIQGVDSKILDKYMIIYTNSFIDDEENM